MCPEPLNEVGTLRTDLRNEHGEHDGHDKLQGSRRFHHHHRGRQRHAGGAPHVRCRSHDRVRGQGHRQLDPKTPAQATPNVHFPWKWAHLKSEWISGGFVDGNAYLWLTLCS